MSTPQIEEAIPTLREHWKRFNVRRAWVFGSRALAHATAASDWDFLVEFVQPPGFDGFMGLRSALEDALSARVDLLSRSACSPRFLHAIEADLVDVT